MQPKTFQLKTVYLMLLCGWIWIFFSACSGGSTDSPQSRESQGSQVDIIAPSVPANIRAEAISTSRISLSWDASTDNTAVSGYWIYRDGVQIATTSATTYSDGMLYADTEYTYTISAFDEEGNASELSQVVRATTLGADIHTYYLAPNGSDTEGDGSYDNPWQTVVCAVGFMKGGDVLVLKDGIYRGIDNQLAPPSGSPGHYTVIRAEHDGQAIVDGSDINGQYDYPMDVHQKQYVQVEGLALRNKANSEIVMIRDSNHIKFLRSSVINKLNYAGSIVRVTGDAHHVLLEDIWVAGAGRYGIIVFKPTATPDQAPHQIILRRCVVRHDYRRRDETPEGGQVYPVAGIQIYGAQPGDESTLVTREILLENCIAIDFNYGEEYYQLSGGLATTARVKDVRFYGNIALNINGRGICLPDPWGCSYGSTFSGFPFGGSRLGDGGNFEYKNNVAWDTSGSGFWFTGGTDPVNGVLIEQNTIGSIEGDQGSGPRAIVDAYSKLQVSVSNNLFYESGLPSPAFGPGDDGSYSEAFNWYYPALLVPSGATDFRTDQPHIQYILMTPDTGSGQDGVKRGAEILYQYGESGTLWGDEGFDRLTDKSLWPWPYEVQIKQAFSEPNDPQANSYPTTNDVKRGFCSDGNGLYGGPVTLTSYIWEYLGNPVPAEIQLGPNQSKTLEMGASPFLDGH